MIEVLGGGVLDLMVDISRMGLRGGVLQSATLRWGCAVHGSDGRNTGGGAIEGLSLADGSMTNRGVLYLSEVLDTNIQRRKLS